MRGYFTVFLSSLLLACCCVAQHDGVTHFSVEKNVDNTESDRVVHGPLEAWAYVTVRPKAHMFYWLYQTSHSAGYQNRPLILWLQGGPGGSGTGFGNFGEIGPLDENLKPRNTTWLQAASLLFVDNPVGTGYSYVESGGAFTTNLKEIAGDLLVLIKQFLKDHPTFKKTPFYIFSESYGGKMTAGFSAVLQKAIADGEVDMNFKGLALGDSWISPVDYTDSWGPYLYATSIVSYTGLMRINHGAKTVRDLVQKGEFASATSAWSSLEDTVEEVGAGVNFYNILDWQGEQARRSRTGNSHNVEWCSSPSHEEARGGPSDGTQKLFERHVRPMLGESLDALMNGQVRTKLKIIPDDVVWGSQSACVFQKQAGDFMTPVTSVVNDLVNQGNLTVVVYNGQLDLICDTMGTEAWFFRTLDVADQFKKTKRQDFKCTKDNSPCFFRQSLRNFHFYWILGAGHMVPQDNGPAGLAMVNQILDKLSRGS